MNDPLQPHSHDNNPLPPDENSEIQCFYKEDLLGVISLAQLKNRFPVSFIPHYLYTTDHGQHGPYRLKGVALGDFIRQLLPDGSNWVEVEVISADGFGNRVYAAEVDPDIEDDPILLCYASNGEGLNRIQGLVRLVVPSETDNALRQIKWVSKIVVK